MHNVAKWDGTQWSEVGGGVNARVMVLHTWIHDDGRPALYAGGQFTLTGGGAAGYLARLVAPAAIGFSPSPPVQIAIAGQPATLSVTPLGAGPFSVQWRKNGIPIPGATSPTHFLSSPSASDAGIYTADVTNGCGNATSPAIVLWVQTFGLSLSLPSGSGSLAVANSGGVPHAPYFTAITFDLLNATQPSLGWLGGLHIELGLAIREFMTAAPPFVGTLDAGGSSTWTSAPGMIPPFMIGNPIWAVTVTIDATASFTGLSSIASLTL
jgi:hypothetical protein